MKYTLVWLTLVAVACGGSEKSADEPTAATAVRPDDDDGQPPDHRRSKVPDIGEADDDDEDISVQGLKGHLAPYDINLGVKAHASDIARCHSSVVRKTRHIGGEIELAYVVNTDGTVKTVTITKSDLGSWKVEGCLLAVARKMVFKKPRGGEADFSLPLEFPARRGVRWWEEERADTEVAEKLVDLEACASAPRNVWVTLYIGTRGKVLSAGFSSPSKEPIADEWAECAAAAITAWTLSDPRGQIAKTGFRYNPE